ncbi:MAG: sigma 54-dependent transcriptional regulator, partial [Planctomycetota bacterium]
SDIEPNLDYELRNYAASDGQVVTFNKESRELFLDFALSDRATWQANFRDLNACVTRMATIAPAGRIDRKTVQEEIGRLQASWACLATTRPSEQDLAAVLPPEKIASLDLFDRMQLAAVLGVCRQSKSLAEAGRKLYQASRQSKSSSNDSDRLRKYLAKYGLSWADLG